MRAKYTSIAFAGLIASLVAVNASANDGTPPWIHQLIQSDETNVTITLGIVDSGEPGIGESYTIERQGAEGQEAVVEGETFKAEEAIETVDRCRGGWESIEDCAADPEGCEDCDGDGVLECDTYNDGWCETVYYFDVTDWCVSEGETSYTLFETDDDWEIDEETIQVEAWGGDCEAPAADTDTDADTDADDDGDGSEGCSVTGVGASEGGAAAPILMLLVGMAVLLRNRNRSSN